METVLITGGSAGIGLELARNFAKNGHTVLIVALDQAEIDAAIADLKRSAPDAALHGLAQDLSQPDAADKVKAWTDEHGWTVDILCNNAGIGLFGDFLEEPHDLVGKMIALNTTTPTYLTRAYLPGMRARGHGRIMMMSSVTTNQATPGHASYSATKAYNDQIGRSLYYGERKLKSGVTVTTVVPAAVRNTDFQKTQGVNFKTFKSGLATTTPQEVARDAYEGIMKGEKMVYTGRRQRILRWLGLPLIPEAMLMPLVFAEIQPVKEK